MEGWGSWLGPAIGAIATIFAAIMLFRSSRKNSSDTTELAREAAKAKLNADIDARVEEQLRDAWSTIASQEKKLEEQKSALGFLTTAQALTDRREMLMYGYIREMRNHIINELPPPPPAIPGELVAFFENLEATDSRFLYPLT